MIRSLLLCCLLAFPAFAAKKPPQVQCAVFGWCKIAEVRNVNSNYTPVVQMGGSQIRVYSNTINGEIDGRLFLRVGSWSSVGSASVVLDISDPRDAYIRTSAVVRGASGNYYALLYTGDGYPTQGGYSPSWATSPDGLAWTWHGPITIFGRNQSSAAALIVDESRTDDYRFMAWIDLSWIGLVLMHSATGAPNDWQSDGLNVWPIPGESPQFVTAARTQYGVHLIGTSPSSSTGLMHIFSCIGFQPWNIIEHDSAVAITGVNGLGGKGTNLVYDAPNNLLHALTSGWHFTLPVRAFPC